MIDKVHIVIVTYNGMQWLSKCLESTKGYDVIVVDNNSNDGTVDYIKKNHPKITLLEQTENLGFGQANNLGMCHALKIGAEYILLLNQDAYLLSGTVEKLIEVHKDNAFYGVISPIHLNGLGNKLDKGFSNYISYNNNNFLYFDAINNSLSAIYEVPFVNAACWLLPKSTLEKVGGFDPLFFHYGEDVNYCQRLKYHGFKVGVIPNTFIRHDREFIKKEQNNQKKPSIDLFYILKWADINADNVNAIKERLKVLKAVRFKALLKLDLSKVKYCNQEIKLISVVVNDINHSRNTNKTLGMHYI